MRRYWWNPARLVFIDESGINLALMRDCAWAPRDERVYDSVPDGRWLLVRRDHELESTARVCTTAASPAAPRGHHFGALALSITLADRRRF